MTMRKQPICYKCAYLLRVKGAHYPLYLAFLDGIPDKIYFDEGEHDKPLFEQKNDLGTL